LAPIELHHRRVWIPSRAHLLISLVVVTFWGISAFAEDKRPSVTPIKDLARHAVDGSPAALAGTVTFVDQRNRLMYVQDDTAAIAVEFQVRDRVAPGDRVHLSGVAFGFAAARPHAAAYRVSGRGPLPAPVPLAERDLTTSGADDRFVQVRGVVRRAHRRNDAFHVHLASGNARIEAVVATVDRAFLEALVDAEVSVNGVWTAVRNKKQEIEGSELLVSSSETIAVTSPAGDPYTLPVRPLGDLRKGLPDIYSGHRIKVHGVVTRYRSNRSLFVTDTVNHLHAIVREQPSAAPGDLVEILGFPQKDGRVAVLEDAVFRRLSAGPPPAARPIGASELSGSDHQFGLVQTSATLLRSDAGSGYIDMLMKSETTTFDARVYLADERSLAADGSQLALTGIASVSYDATGRTRSVRLLVSSPDDVVVVSPPAWWTVRKLMLTLLVIGIALAGSAGWILALHRRLPRAERALRHTEAQYKEIFEQGPAGNFITSVDGSILACNDTFARLLGFRNADEARRSNANAFYPDAETRQDLLRRLKLDRRVENHEATLVRADGTPFYVIENISGRFDSAGNLTELRGFLFDVTEKKQTEAALRSSEAQLRQAAKMEAVGRLAGGIAHDFNNLLTAIIGYAELAMSREPLVPEVGDDLEQIRTAGNSAAALTRQLLAFSRKQMLKPEIVDLNDVIAELGKILRRVLGEDIAFDTRLAPQPVWVLADRSQFEQVLMNLAINARDAMPAGGSLHFATHTRHDQAIVTIRDTGCGIDAETLPHIFEPFFTTKEVGKGTGLGLAMVYGFVTQSGGTVSVDSVHGRGSTFTIALPSSQPEAQPSTEMSAPPVSGGSETILVVEDEPNVSAFIQAVLERQGYTVITADGAREALAAVERTARIDLLLTDVVMAETSGPELVSQLAPEQRGMKVLFMSGYADHPALREAVIPSAAQVLEKPFNPQQLCTAVRQRLNQDLAAAVA